MGMWELEVAYSGNVGLEVAYRGNVGTRGSLQWECGN